MPNSVDDSDVGLDDLRLVVTVLDFLHGSDDGREVVAQDSEGVAAVGVSRGEEVLQGAQLIRLVEHGWPEVP